MSEKLSERFDIAVCAPHTWSKSGPEWCEIGNMPKEDVDAILAVLRAAESPSTAEAVEAEREACAVSLEETADKLMCAARSWVERGSFVGAANLQMKAEGMLEAAAAIRARKEG